MLKRIGPDAPAGVVQLVARIKGQSGTNERMCAPVQLVIFISPQF